MKNILVNGKMVALDGEHEFGLSFCYNTIKAWKSWNFKKNCRKKATIQVRQKYEIGEKSIYTKNWIELSLDGKITEKYRIRDEAYDILSRDMPNEEYPGNIVFTTLESFTPVKKANSAIIKN